MTNEEQIKLLMSAKEWLYDTGMIGICGSIKAAYGGTYVNPQELIPTFNYENVMELSKKYNFKPPRFNIDVDKEFWWDCFPSDKRARLKCIDALINELKNE